MALLWIEGFEGFGTTVGGVPSPAGIVARKYATVDSETLLDVEAGRFAGYGLELTSNGQRIRSVSLTTDATVVLGIAVKFTLIPTAADFILLFDDTTQGMSLRITTGGELEVRSGVVQLGITSGLGLVSGVWYYIEFKVTCNATTGSYTLRVDGSTVLSDSGVDTKSGTHDYHNIFQLYCAVGTVPTFDDLYFLDSTGSQNNDLLGNCRVEAVYPDADSGTVQWTPSTGTDHYALVDEAVCNDDTDYVEDGTTDDKDLYDYAALQYITGGIKGLQVNTQARITDATSFNLKTTCHSGTTDSDDAGQALAASYANHRRVIELDPDTAAAWTVSGVNAAQFGVKVG